ncbi:MAG: dihydroorotate dehydrogenase electron transfer subunit [Promethearchaeota archaeon]
MSQFTPLAVEVTSRREETPTITSLTINVASSGDGQPPAPHPGQFVMVWIPGVDEIPLSVSDVADDEWQVTVKEVGEATKALRRSPVGSKLGVRGPFGNGFELRGEAPLLCGGGVGAAPLLLLARRFVERGVEPRVVLAAPNERELLFLERFETWERAGRLQLYCSTDDGSRGFCGLAHECLAEALDAAGNCDGIFACGPEAMLVATMRLAAERELPFQASLERVMRCGMGLCGLCVLDSTGARVCTEGPVFTGEELKGIADFGSHARDLSGKKQETGR